MGPNALPASMRAVLLTGYGGYEKLALRRDVPVPTPGPKDVIIRVNAAGVNNTDINTRIGWYAKSAPQAPNGDGTDLAQPSDQTGWSGTEFVFPRIQGADACGTIVAIGSGVDPSRLGERVLVEPVFRRSNAFDVLYFGSEVDGAFAEFTCVPSIYAHQVTSCLSDIELASLPCAYSAAENMLTRIGLSHNERVLITGASGGVGSAAVQLAKRRGAEVFAVTQGGKGPAVRALGADHIIAREAPLKALFTPTYFDAVVDVVGGPSFAAYLEVLRPGGRYATSGAIAGPRVELDLRTLYLKDLRLFGCTVLEPDVFPNLIRYLAQDEIRPSIAATYPLDKIVAAQQAFLEKRHIGKIVLSLNDAAAP